MTDLQRAVLNHPRNENVEFYEDEHRYFVDDGNGRHEVNGITSLIKEYAEEFDKEGISKFIAYRDGRTQEDVLAEWKAKGDKAIAYGNRVHNLIEDYICHGTESDDIEFETYQRAIEDLGLTPVTAEWVVYDERLGRASAIDGVYERDGKLVLVDFKTNEEMTYEGYKGKTLFYPLHHMQDCKYSKYTIQLNIYHKIVKDLYDLPISDEMYILHLRDDWYDWLPVLNHRSEVDSLYEREEDFSS